MILTRTVPVGSANYRKMSVHGVADKIVEILEGGKYPFVVLNLANPDMVVYFEIKLTLGGTYRCL